MVEKYLSAVIHTHDNRYLVIASLDGNESYFWSDNGKQADEIHDSLERLFNVDER